MRACIVLAFLFLFSSGYGQSAHSGKVTGAAKDESGEPVPFASVVLLSQKDSSLVRAAVADSSGEFTVDEIKSGSYFLQVFYTGYQRFMSLGFSIEGNDYNAGTLTLTKKSTDLKEVSVTAIKPFVEHRFDKTIVNVDNSIVNAGSTAYEILKRAPGVLITEDEVIRLKGKSGTIVMIDGKPSPVTGEALAAMLRGLPSSAVSTIEIITNPSAKYDAAGNAGIINIVTKRDKRMGTNGNISASVGEGRYAKASAGALLNYRNSNWSAYASYNYTYRKGLNLTDHVRNFHTNGQLTDILDQDIYATFPSDAHVPRLGVDYRATQKTTVGAQLSGMFNFINLQADNYTYELDGNEMRTGSFQTVSNNHNDWYNYNGNLNLRHQFDSLGRELTADLDYSYYRNGNVQFFTTYTYDAADALLSEDVLKGNQDGLLYIYAAKADYTHPLKNNARFEAGLKSSYVKSDNNLRYFNRIADVDYPDTLNSNHFIYSENINAAYINASREWKKFTLQLGLRVEQTLAKGTQLANDSVFTHDYAQPFFSMAMNYKFNDNHEMALTMSRRISRPEYQELNPFRRYVDHTTYGAGNPFLVPALTLSTDLSFTFAQALTFTINYSYTQDVYETVFLQDDITRTTVQTEANIGTNRLWNFSVIYSKQLTPWYQTSSEFDIWDTHYDGSLSGTNLQRSKPAYYFNTTNTFILPKNFSLEAGGFYQSDLIVGELDINSTWEANFGAQKKIMKNKGVLKFNITDIFWTNSSSGGANFANIQSHFLSHHETRVGTLAFVYNFGKAGAQVKKRSGSDEEKGRVKIGG